MYKNKKLGKTPEKKIMKASAIADKKMIKLAKEPIKKSKKKTLM